MTPMFLKPPSGVQPRVIFVLVSYFYFLRSGIMLAAARRTVTDPSDGAIYRAADHYDQYQNDN